MLPIGTSVLSVLSSALQDLEGRAKQIETTMFDLDPEDVTRLDFGGRDDNGDQMALIMACECLKKAQRELVVLTGLIGNATGVVDLMAQDPAQMERICSPSPDGSIEIPKTSPMSDWGCPWSGERDTIRDTNKLSADLDHAKNILLCVSRSTSCQ